MVDLTRRADPAELMELMDEPCSYEELRACLRDIARVNRLTGTYAPTLAWLETVVAKRPELRQRLRIVDVGSGYGDMLRQIERWAREHDVVVELIGVDLNPDAVRAAREATSPTSGIAWFSGDVYSCAEAQDADVVISSLVMHHLSESEIVRLLRWMDATARVGWFVNDLHRQVVPYYLFSAMATVLRLHRFVRYDGPVSIRRSFLPEEWRGLCAAAGVSGAAITEHRPARLCVGRVR